MATAVEQALYSKATGTGALTSLLASATSVYPDGDAPRSATFDYVVYALQGGGPDNDNPHDAASFLYLIKAISATSRKKAQQIHDQIRVAFHRATLTVTGWTAFSCVLESERAYVETTPEGVRYYHAGGVYRIRAEKT